MIILLRLSAWRQNNHLRYRLSINRPNKRKKLRENLAKTKSEGQEDKGAEKGLAVLSRTDYRECHGNGTFFVGET